MTPEQIWERVQRERAYQIEKHGVDRWTPAQWFLILSCEVEEVARAIKDAEFGRIYDDTDREASGLESMRAELIDVMATCQAILEAYGEWWQA